MFSWTGPSGVHFNVTTTTEDDSRTATSTLHIDTITHRHGGVYQCTVSNGGVLNDTTLSEIIVQGMCCPIYHVTCLTISNIFIVHPTRPREFNIISEDIYSITLRWTDPAHTHGPIDHYNVNMLIVWGCVSLLLVVICSFIITALNTRTRCLTKLLILRIIHTFLLASNHTQDTAYI